MRQQKRKEPVVDRYMFPFMRETIAQLQNLGKIRTSETYRSALSSFMRFRKGRDIRISDITDDVLISYEDALKVSGLSSIRLHFICGFCGPYTIGRSGLASRSRNILLNMSTPEWTRPERGRWTFLR